jgi:hypothetical protein
VAVMVVKILDYVPYHIPVTIIIVVQYALYSLYPTYGHM